SSDNPRYQDTRETANLVPSIKTHIYLPRPTNNPASPALPPPWLPESSRTRPKHSAPVSSTRSLPGKPSSCTAARAGSSCTRPRPLPSLPRSRRASACSSRWPPSPPPTPGPRLAPSPRDPSPRSASPCCARLPSCAPPRVRPSCARSRSTRRLSRPFTARMGCEVFSLCTWTTSHRPKARKSLGVRLHTSLTWPVHAQHIGRMDITYRLVELRALLISGL
ncbi:hypothetical protein GGS26DRAFT_599093, partial [Hypomontagnella submonticulosa]